LCRITKAVDSLQGQCLLFGKKLDFRVAQCAAYAGVKSYRLPGSPFTNLSPAVEDRGFEKHLEGVIQQNEDRRHTPTVVSTIEVLDTQNQRV
jgi:hypothetical protein